MSMPLISHPLNSEDDTESVDPKDRQDLINEGALGCDDPVIKDMKLKGEFPCRLCPLVYPNLRALKGHNKEHMNKAPYVCNVGQCTYSSNDKGTLVRHMRNHTGEKPFEVLAGFFIKLFAKCSFSIVRNATSLLSCVKS